MLDDADLLKKKVESMTSENKRVERQLRMEALTTGSMSEISRKGTEIKRLTHEVQQLQEKLEEEVSLGEKEAKAVAVLEERVANAGQRPATNEGWEELLKKYEEQVKERDEKLDKLEAEEEDWMQSTNELQNLSDLAVKVRAVVTFLFVSFPFRYFLYFVFFLLLPFINCCYRKCKRKSNCSAKSSKISKLPSLMRQEYWRRRKSSWMPTSRSSPKHRRLTKIELVRQIYEDIIGSLK